MDTKTKYVSVVERSGDTKLSHTKNVSVSWLSHASCPGASPDDPKPCPFLKTINPETGEEEKGPCYALMGRAYLASKRLKDRTDQSELPIEDLRLEIARQEAEGIRALTGLRKFRGRASGDSTTNEEASIVGSAMVEHEAKHGMAAWTYTHSAETIDHESWQGARVNASCHTVEEVRRYRAKGYGTVLIVPKHPTHHVYQYQGETIIPCPAQLNKKVDCEHCTLCQRPDWLRENKLSVGFQPDYQTEKKIIRLMNVA